MKYKEIWSQEKVDALNSHQKDFRFHPYTCGFNRTDEKHLDGVGRLIATVYGWVCPYCEYKQNFVIDEENNTQNNDLAN